MVSIPLSHMLPPSPWPPTLACRPPWAQARDRAFELKMRRAAWKARSVSVAKSDEAERCHELEVATADVQRFPR